MLCTNIQRNGIKTDELSFLQVSADQSESQSSREYVESSKKPAATQENNNKSGAEKSGAKGLEQHHWVPPISIALYKSNPQPVQIAMDAQDSDAKN